MDSAVRTSSSPWSYARFWASILVVVAVVFYLMIRECFAPRITTAGQQAFTLVYSLLISAACTLCLTRIMRGSPPPRWLDASWKRILAAAAGAMVLGAVSLPLPGFYGELVRHTLIFAILPLAWVGRTNTCTARWMEGAPASPAFVASLAQEPEREVVLQMSRRKAFPLVAIGSIFLACGGWRHSQASAMAWLGIAVAALCIPLGCMMLLPGFAFLRMGPDSFTMRHAWRQYSFRWDEISDLTVVSGPQGSRVAFNVHKPVRRSAMLRQFYGRDMMLIDNYGLSAPDLCALMQTRQAGPARSPA